MTAYFGRLRRAVLPSRPVTEAGLRPAPARVLGPVPRLLGVAGRLGAGFQPADGRRPAVVHAGKDARDPGNAVVPRDRRDRSHGSLHQQDVLFRLILRPWGGEPLEATPGSRWAFLPGMTFHTYRLVDGFGFSETIAVTRPGYERLANYPRRLIIVR